MWQSGSIWRPENKSGMIIGWIGLAAQSFIICIVLSGRGAVLRWTRLCATSQPLDELKIDGLTGLYLAVMYGDSEWLCSIWNILLRSLTASNEETDSLKWFHLSNWDMTESLSRYHIFKATITWNVHPSKRFSKTQWTWSVGKKLTLIFC